MSKKFNIIMAGILIALVIVWGHLINNVNHHREIEFTKVEQLEKRMDILRERVVKLEDKVYLHHNEDNSTHK